MQVLQGGLSLKPVRVLVADDDAVLRSLVCANLAGRVDSVTEAGDGQQAWEMLLGGSFELALIDLSMPGLDGYALIRCIRNHPRTRHLPIVVVTSTTDQDAVRRAFEVGATSFLTKPINWNLFGHQIDYLIRLDQGNATERATKRRAEAVARAKDALIAALAARVRQQTAGLVDMAELELWRRQDGEERGREFAGQVLAEARAIEDMLEDVLPFVRSMTEQIVVNDRPVSVSRLLEASAESLRRMAQQGDVVIMVDDVDPALMVCCDEAAIMTALGNLVRNAVEFTKPGTTVQLSVEIREDQTLCISVDDEGPGADPEAIARSLSPLDLRESNVMRLPEQAALGLPLAKAIAQAHGGTIEVVAKSGSGTRACLILPAEIVEARFEDVA